MVKLASAFSRLNSVKVLVVGDLLMDTYTVGKARRISPEAPVAIVHVQQEDHRPGGSGNVILNLVSLGAEVVALGRIGADWMGDTLYQALKQEKVDVRFIFKQEHYRTPVKNRIISDSQQLVRIDYETIVPLSEDLEQQMIDALPTLLQDIKVLAISDYGKGFLTPTLLTALISQARQRGILIITDPKGHDFVKYRGTSVIKPNLSEAYVAANLPHHAPLEKVAHHLLQLTEADVVMITRSEAGISLFHQTGERQDFPVHIREVKDVTGAGDTVLAMLTYALGNELLYAEAAQLCNVAAGIAIEHVGCMRVTLSDLAHCLLESNILYKVFDPEHLFALQQVLMKHSFTIVAVSQEEGLTASLFKAIKEVRQKEVGKLLLFVAEAEPNETFVEILASLKEVDFILVQSKSFKILCERLSPSQIYTFHKGLLKETSQQTLSLSEPMLIC